MTKYSRTMRRYLTKSDGSDFEVSLAAYAANDDVGGGGKVIYSTGFGLTLLGVSIRDNTKQDIPFIIHLYRSPIDSAIADNAPFVPSSADGDLEIGQIVVPASKYITTSGSTYSKAYVPIPIEMAQVDIISEESFDVRLQNTLGVTYTGIDDLKIEFVYWID